MGPLRRSFKRLKSTLRCKSLPDSSSLDVSTRPSEDLDSESESQHSSAHFYGRAGTVQDLYVSSSTVTARLVPRDADVLQVQGTDGFVLGSAGFWNEVMQEKALLRLHHHTCEAPSASDSNPALHLTNYALHNVARRQRACKASHPCTPDMSSVAALQSLWVGSADEEGTTPPHMRYRGDVHGDMNVIVVQLTHSGSRESSTAQALSRSDMIKAFAGDSAECGKDLPQLGFSLFRPSIDATVAAGV
ncbi:hypothetical protein WJX73_001561 [Symbiochloris irregularis]|uniref:PPM-type phosphatase domain-containing protein n=1 Tax=Symbiochloris irregularis TaxID=706552 RepID=A0AAW1NRU6_9CHLO